MSHFIFEQLEIQTVAVYNGLNNQFKMVGSIHWPNRDSAPPDMPKCGFNNEKCDNSELNHFTIFLYILSIKSILKI